MCMFCNDVTSGKPGVMFKDAKGNFCSLVWFEYEQMPELHIKSDGSFAYVQVFNCPICGRSFDGLNWEGDAASTEKEGRL